MAHPRSRYRRPWLSLAILAGLAVAGCDRAEQPEPGNTPAPATASASPPAKDGVPSTPDTVPAAVRDAALRTAQVWRPPARPADKLDLKSNPAGEGAFGVEDVVECQLVLKAMGGTTPKFDCQLPSGDVIRVKYGRGNPELNAEVAATRLLAALGFGADRMYVVRQVRCAGCSPFPFHSLRCLAETGLQRACFPPGLTSSTVARFDHVVIERRLAGRRIEATPDQGWAWFELDKVDAGAGGAPRQHLDALKLAAVVLAHWDNKAENQRLLCLPGGDTSGGGCSQPLAILQDLGASFGPLKLDLVNWRATPVWSDARECRVSMEHLPWGGGTFPEQRISEGGRRFLLERFDALSRTQFVDLFAGARVGDSETVTAEGRRPEAWAEALAQKIQQVREAGPCPG